MRCVWESAIKHPVISGARILRAHAKPSGTLEAMHLPPDASAKAEKGGGEICLRAGPALMAGLCFVDPFRVHTAALSCLCAAA